VIFKSPGVLIPADFTSLVKGKVITSQTQVMLECFGRQTIGITGTKGKSTTSSLIYHILQHSGQDAVLVGNIGTPPFDQAESIGLRTRIVFELSSNQLEDIGTGPAIAVILNLFPEHLDRYDSLESYYSAKMNILLHQQEGDTVIYNSDSPVLAGYAGDYSGRRCLLGFSARQQIRQGCFLEAGRVLCCLDGETSDSGITVGELNLKGQHNQMNIMAAILACRGAGVSPVDIPGAIRSFHGLEHRLEYVGKFRDIHFYNDSIATIPEATLEAVKAVPDTDTLILGGYDRMLDYRGMTESLLASDVRNFILMGQSGKRMLHLLSRGNIPAARDIYYVHSLEEAVVLASGITAPGKACLLSPASASYDLFRNFEERGRLFKELVRKL
jgi:UDP-N-acetylmuramoylalanine--D-glutamate ligase